MSCRGRGNGEIRKGTLLKRARGMSIHRSSSRRHWPGSWRGHPRLTACGPFLACPVGLPCLEAELPASTAEERSVADAALRGLGRSCSSHAGGIVGELWSDPACSLSQLPACRPAFSPTCYSSGGEVSRRGSHDVSSHAPARHLECINHTLTFTEKVCRRCHDSRGEARQEKSSRASRGGWTRQTAGAGKTRDLHRIHIQRVY
jgi:hypothetical protein